MDGRLRAGLGNLTVHPDIHKTEQTEEKDLDLLHEPRITKLANMTQLCKRHKVPEITQVHLIEIMVLYEIEQEII